DDRLKLHHLIELLPVGIRVGQAAEMHESLSPVERERLDRHVRALQEYLAGQGPQPSVRMLGGALTGLYDTLPPDQREELDQHLRALQQRTVDQVQQLPTPLLLEVVCLSMATEDGPGGPR